MTEEIGDFMMECVRTSAPDYVPTPEEKKRMEENAAYIEMMEAMQPKVDLPKHSVKNGIHYTLGEHDLYYPDFTMPSEEEAKAGLGFYGLQALEYLKEEHQGRYMYLLMMDELNPKMKEVQEEAWTRHWELEKAYLKKHPVTKEMEFMEKVQLRNQARAYAREIVLDEIVNRYH